MAEQNFLPVATGKRFTRAEVVTLEGKEDDEKAGRITRAQLLAHFHGLAQKYGFDEHDFLVYHSTGEVLNLVPA